MKEELCSFEVAKLAKEKGFSGAFGWGYQNSESKLDLYRGRPNYPASTLSLLQKWLREEHNIIVVSIPQYNTGREFRYFYFTINGKPDDNEGEFNTYEEALENGIVFYLKSQKDVK